MTMIDCPLCRPQKEVVVHASDELCVVLVNDLAYPGYCRVIWGAHATEMTDLAPAQAMRLMGAVFAVEAALRTVLKPAKVNLASLGNVVPHLHWHVIPRFADDAHFPQPVWGQRQRESDVKRLAARRAQIPALCASIVDRLSDAA